MKHFTPALAIMSFFAFLTLYGTLLYPREGTTQLLLSIVITSILLIGSVASFHWKRKDINLKHVAGVLIVLGVLAMGWLGYRIIDVTVFSPSLSYAAHFLLFGLLCVLMHFVISKKFFHASNAVGIVVLYASALALSSEYLQLLLVGSLGGGDLAASFGGVIVAYSLLNIIHH